MKDSIYWNRNFRVQFYSGKLEINFIRIPAAISVFRYCLIAPLLLGFCLVQSQVAISRLESEQIPASLKVIYDNPEINPFIVENNTGNTSRISKGANLKADDVLKLYTSSPSIHFELVKVSKSRSKVPAVYKRYQQYYRDVKVEGGILILRETRKEGAEPYIDLISSNVHPIPEMDVQPLINETVLHTLFKEKIVKADLVIASIDDIFKLTWIVQLAVESGNIQWVEANSAHILKEYTPQLNHSAETPTYGQKTLLHDCSSGGITSLQACDESIRIFDGLEVSGISDFDTDYIPMTTDLDSWDSDASPGALQAFHVVESIKPIFESIDIPFQNINVAISGQASAIYGSNTSNAYLKIGEYVINGVAYPAQLYDIIAHELGHCILLEQGLEPLVNTGNNALHEGISDIIGTYIESFIQGVDWTLGDDDGGRKRYLQHDVCFTDLPGPPNEDAHVYGLVIGHMFYLIVNGSPVDDIPSIGLHSAMDIILEAIQLINDPDTDYNDMRAHTLTSAATLFGVCSPHYKAVKNAWIAVCVTGFSQPCPCPYSAPTLSDTEVVDDCPISVDLSPLHIGTTPAGAVLVWSTDGDPWTGHGASPIIDPEVESTGTYYAYYYNEVDDCFSPASDGVVVDGVASSDITISVDTDYDTDQEIFGDVYVEDGAVMTITATLTLDTDVDIFVEDGSKLVLDGGTLTACGDQWQGIKVAGQFDLGSYSPAGSSNLLRGYVELKNSATIEKAVVGIDGRDVFVAAGDTPSGMPIYHGGGKITISSGSTLLDCGIGVRLHRYGWGSVIGAGSTGPGYPIGYEDEPSAFSNSFFKNCTTAAIYSDQNIGLYLYNNEFDGNFYDYEGYLSSITAIDNDFLSPQSLLGSEYPVVPGSTFSNNYFDTTIGIDGQGNIKRHYLNENVANASLIYLTGELMYGISGNEFANSGGMGLFVENTGEGIRNWVIDNAFSGQWSAISVFGENDTEYLANCFSSTSYAGIEVNSGASIHIAQGSQLASAGNCFTLGAPIETGEEISTFNYWTKDGFDLDCDPVVNCKYPGDCDGFTLRQAQEETEEDCESDFTGEPPLGLNCECDSGQNGCTDAISSIRTTIAGLGGNSGDDFLLAQYRRCLDSLIRTYTVFALDSGHVEDCIDFLSAQPEFRYRILAYSIITQNLQYNRAAEFLDTLQTTNSAEEEFVKVQSIWLNYLMGINAFKLSADDSLTIRSAGEAYNSLAGYARTVFYKLTGEQISREFVHTDNTITQRSTSEVLSAEKTPIPLEFHVWPNPISAPEAEFSLEGTDPNKEYIVMCYDALGVLCQMEIVINGKNQITIDDRPGLYIVCLFSGGELISMKKILRM